jgi:hypothetical protein
MASGITAEAIQLMLQEALAAQAEKMTENHRKELAELHILTIVGDWGNQSPTIVRITPTMQCRSG